MRQNFDTVRRFGRPVGLVAALGLASCSSSTSQAPPPNECTSPPAISRSMDYPPAFQGDTATWGFIIIHVAKLSRGEDEVSVGFTDPAGNVHKSKPISSDTLDAYPDTHDGKLSDTNRIVVEVGSVSTKFLVTVTADCGSTAAEAAPTVQFGTNGDPGQSGPVKINAQPAPLGSALTGEAAYWPSWSTAQKSNGVPATPNAVIFTTAA